MDNKLIDLVNEVLESEMNTGKLNKLTSVDRDALDNLRAYIKKMTKKED